MNKYHHLETVQAKIDVIHHQIKGFIELFNPLFKRGLPFFLDEKGGMWSQKEYNDRLINCILYHRQFDDMQQQSLSVKTVIDKLAIDLKCCLTLKLRVPNYQISLIQKMWSSGYWLRR